MHPGKQDSWLKSRRHHIWIHHDYSLPGAPPQENAVKRRGSCITKPVGITAQIHNQRRRSNTVAVKARLPGCPATTNLFPQQALTAPFWSTHTREIPHKQAGTWINQSPTSRESSSGSNVDRQPKTAAVEAEDSILPLY